MKKKSIIKEYRIRFVTKDGAIVMNRLASDFLFKGELHGYELKLLEHTLKHDATEHGVRIVSHKKIDDHTIEALVEEC